MSANLAPRQHFLFFWVVPILLGTLAIFIALNFIPNLPFSVVVQDFTTKNLTHWKTTELLAHQYIEGKFTADKDDMGILAVRFYNFRKISTDSVEFRMKQVGQKTWFYEAQYKVDQFQPNEEFTFGFPIQQHSRDKTYVFQVESLRGKHQNAIGLSKIEPVFTAKYKYTKEYFIKNKQFILSFIWEKAVSIFSNAASSYYFLAYVFLGSVIMVGYYLRLLFKERLPYGSLLIGTFFLFVGVYIFSVSLLHPPALIVTLAILWMVISEYYYLSSNISFFLSLVFLVLGVIAKLFGNMDTADYVIDWTYVFLLIGLLQIILIEPFGQEDKRIDAVTLYFECKKLFHKVV